MKDSAPKIYEAAGSPNGVESAGPSSRTHRSALITSARASASAV